MPEHEYVTGDFHVTVFSIPLRDGRYRADVVVRRIGSRESCHRQELYGQVFATRSDARAHGQSYAEKWLLEFGQKAALGSPGKDRA
ncbi:MULTISPECIES: hypothetical protein [Pandoraea]|uniref:hypothetical protein n=1 Tax=Pandoraea TaxID=93217 RepID=UPI001F5C36F3|nr:MULTISPECIES: hypothetical protein [Pandoraea]MCI3208662.1 hypothetical protein [Pandoraea sp. LA3]MDN4586691.1 hypothetical protein [Pandoraea capi]